MKIELKNIGKIRSASVDLDGITVIAGENNTGKSTVSKALYCSYKSSYNIEGQVKALRVANIQDSLNSLYRDNIAGVVFGTKDLVDNLIDNQRMYTLTPNLITTAIRDSHQNSKWAKEIIISDEAVERTSNKILQILSMEDSQIMSVLARRVFMFEFGFQIVNVFTQADGCVSLSNKNETTEFNFNNNQELTIRNPIRLENRILYLDDPFVIDDLSGSAGHVPLFSTHRSDLLMLLSENLPSQNVILEILTDQRLNNIYQQISTVLPGDIIQTEDMSFSYRTPGRDQFLDIQNLSAGLKTFAVLKRLLKNGSIESGSMIILDEPEIHLHPKWQILFAELIALLRKEFDLNILLTTHSPYFFEAIEAFSIKHKVSKDCHYYLARNMGDFSEIEDVTRNTEPVYKLLAEPFQTLTDVEDSDD